MKTKTMEIEIITQKNRMCRKDIDPNDYKSWNYLYTLENILNACKDFRSTKKVVSDLEYLNFIYQNCLDNYEIEKKDPFNRLWMMDEYHINMYNDYNTLKKQLKERVETINYIMQPYITSKDNIKKLSIN